MQIANPIYDVVFKYLMEDNKIAKLMISIIIGEKVAELELMPTESSAELPQHKSLTVYRLDFSARIKVGKGRYKQVIIESQKAKMPSDIIRFRSISASSTGAPTACTMKKTGGGERRRRRR